MCLASPSGLRDYREEHPTLAVSIDRNKFSLPGRALRMSSLRACARGVFQLFASVITELDDCYLDGRNRVASMLTARRARDYSACGGNSRGVAATISLTARSLSSTLRSSCRRGLDASSQWSKITRDVIGHHCTEAGSTRRSHYTRRCTASQRRAGGGACFGNPGQRGRVEPLI